MYTTKTNFKDFINFYNKEYYSSKLMNNRSKGLWNPKRQDYLKQYNNNRTSFLSELEEMGVKSFKDFVPNEFFSEKKSKNIFSNFLQDLSQEISKNKNALLTIDSCSIIAEEKEEYEMIKRNLNKYLEYIMEKNFFLLKYYTKNVNLFYLKIEDSLVKIELMKKKMNFIKKRFFLANTQIYLKHQKRKNVKNIYNNLINLREFKKMYLFINSKKNTNPKITGKTIETKSKFNKTEELIKKIEKFKYYNKSLICFWFIQNLKFNQNDFKNNYEELLSKLFLTKISVDEFSSIYDIFLSLNSKSKNIKEINNELLDKIIIFYKKAIFNMIKGILLSYATIDFSDSINSNKIFKLKQLQELSFEERKLFLAINQICITILSFCDNIYSYLNSNQYKNTKLFQILYNNRKMFYNIMIKKLKKILFLYTDLILNFQDETNIYLILSSFSLVYIYIEKTFLIEEISSPPKNNNNLINNNNNKNVVYNNNNKNNNLIKKITVNNNKMVKKTKLNLNINNTNIIENNIHNDTNSNIIINNNNDMFKTELINFYEKLSFFLMKQKIKNLSIYLGKDSWTKINIHNLNEQINERKMVIIKYKDFLSLPFKNVSLDKNEIKNQITNLSNFKENKNIKINLNNLFNKKINERNFIFSSSSFFLFQYILDIFSYSLIIPTIKTNILNKIFDIYDYFIYATFNMFHKDKINIEKIKQKISENKNIKSMSYEDLLNKSKDVEFIQNYINFISFLYECKKQVLVKVVGNERALFTILPSLNPQISATNKIENNINIDNYIEKIICYECYWTIFKVIKRIVPLKKSDGNNEIYNSKVNKYKIILKEIQHFIYYPLSYKLIKNNSYINNFINNNWQISANSKTANNKLNLYIQIILGNIKDINDKLIMFLPISLKARIRFIYIFLILMFDKIKENIDKIKNINKEILNTIINIDIKNLKNKLTEIINCNDNGNEINSKSNLTLFDNIFNKFVEYLNIIIMNKNNFINNVGKNKIPLHLINNLRRMNKLIAENDKSKIKSDVRCIYVKEIQIINDILNKCD